MAGKIVVDALTRYKADVNDHVKKLKKLRGEERKRNDALIKELEGQTERYDSMVKTVKRVTVAVAAIGSAALIAKESFETFQEDVKLRAGAAGADMERLRKSTSGLVDDVELMKLAQQGLRGEYKLTQGELETVSKSLLVFRKEGRDLAESSKRVGDAIRTGNVEPLKELGMVLTDDLAKLKIQNETYESQQLILKALGEKITATGGDYSLATDEMDRASVMAKNGIRDFKVALGELVTQIAAHVLPFLTKLISRISEIPDQVREIMNLIETGNSDADLGRFNQARAAQSFLGTAKSGQRPKGKPEDLITGLFEFSQAPGTSVEIDRRVSERANVLNQRKLDRLKAIEDEKLRGGSRAIFGDVQRFMRDHQNEVRKAAEAAAREAEKRALSGARAAAAKRREELKKLGKLGQGIVGGVNAGTGALGGFLGGLNENLGADIAGRASGLADVGRQALGAISGGIGQFIPDSEGRSDIVEQNQATKAAERLAELNKAIETAQPAFDLAGGAAASAYSAIITGSMSAGKAVKQFAGQFLIAEGTRLAGIAVSSGVQALFQLALGDPRAVLSFKAAAAAGAGAAAIFALAKGLGVSGANAPNVAGKAGGKAVGLGAGRGGPKTEIIVLGDGFDSGTHREKLSRFGQLMERVERQEGSVRAGVAS